MLSQWLLLFSDSAKENLQAAVVRMERLAQRPPLLRWLDPFFLKWEHSPSFCIERCTQLFVTQFEIFCILLQLWISKG
jgi:hypothetical protein